MQLFDQQGVDMHTNGAAGPAIWQIGSDGGLLNNPVKLAEPANGNRVRRRADRQRRGRSGPAPTACSSRPPSAPT